MSEELEVLKIVTLVLDRRGIPYMITGSTATNFYTVPRMTRDVDIVIELEAQKVDRIYEAFKDEFYVDRESMSEAVVRRRSFNIIHNRTLVKIDFIIQKESEYRKLELSRRRSVTVEGIPLYIASPEDLIISKLLWARKSHSEMQLNDVRNILTDVKDIDKVYLEKWIAKLGLEDVYGEVK